MCPKCLSLSRSERASLCVSLVVSHFVLCSHCLLLACSLLYLTVTHCCISLYITVCYSHCDCLTMQDGDSILCSCSELNASSRPSAPVVGWAQEVITQSTSRIQRIQMSSLALLLPLHLQLAVESVQCLVELLPPPPARSQLQQTICGSSTV